MGKRERVEDTQHYRRSPEQFRAWIDRLRPCSERQHDGKSWCGECGEVPPYFVKPLRHQEWVREVLEPSAAVIGSQLYVSSNGPLMIFDFEDSTLRPIRENDLGIVVYDESGAEWEERT